MFRKLTSALDVLHKGRMVADPAAWKTRDLLTSSIAALLAALYVAARAIGYDLPIDAEGLDMLAAGIAAVLWLFHAGTTVASTDKVGLPPVDPPDRGSGRAEKDRPYGDHTDDIFGA